MNQTLKEKIMESLAAVLPITLIVLALSIFLVPLGVGAVVMFFVGAIMLIFTMASYTYGPLLGLFAFGLFVRRRPMAWAVPLFSIIAPALSYVVASNSEEWFSGYEFSYEILLVNASIMFVALALFSRREEASL